MYNHYSVEHNEKQHKNSMIKMGCFQKWDSWHTLKVKREYPGVEESHRMKNATRDKLKNLCIKNKAWYLKKHLLEIDVEAINI